MLRLSHPLLFSLLAVLAVGCASSAFKSAQQQDTAAAYRAFLQSHPDDPNVDAARLALSEKEFEAASGQHTLLAYKRFLEEFPDVPRAAAARTLLEGIRFNVAKQSNTPTAWRQFLRDHPDGAHREEAEKLLAEAEFAAATSGNAPSSLSRLIRERPEDPRRLQLQQQLDDQTFAAAREGGAFALFAYLRDFPAGAHRLQAQAALFSLKIDGLLVSGLIDRARQEIATSPLAGSVEGLDARVRDAEARAKLLAASDPAIRAAQAAHYLRSVTDLERALSAPDPLDRWQAAEELGQHVSVAAIDPLLNALRTARNALIRQRALESLRAILAALPKPVSDYEVASRLDGLAPTAGSAETWTIVAVLLDLSGRLSEAATEYQRAWDKSFPDALILRRWVEIRRDRKQPFSAAVAARQLSLWAEERVKIYALPARGDRLPVSDARELCAAAQNARFALDAVREAKGIVTEFPEDIARFEVTATETLRLAEARLKDAELLLRAQDPHARTCDDRRVADRMLDAVRQRSEAIRALSQRRPTEVTRGVLSAVREGDPSFEVRSLASQLATRGAE